MSIRLSGISGIKLFFGRTGHIGYIAPFAVFFQYAGASAHYVAVNVDGVDRVSYSHTVVMAEYVAYVSRIASWLRSLM